MIRKIIPKALRFRLRLIKRYCTDIIGGHYSSFAKVNRQDANYDFEITLAQEIKLNSTAVGKVENIKLAFSRTQNVVIFPGEVFSFWHLIGNPSKENGFKKGRNLISGVLTEDYGGGLCQLSGIIYHLSLVADLKIVERFNHTIDIYTDETRFTPLGSDATVVYAYKDLRIRNDYDFPVIFDFEISDNALIAKLRSPIEVKEKKIIFEKQIRKNTIEVLTLDQHKNIIAKSVYKRNH